MGYCCNWGLVYRHPVTCISNLSSQVILCGGRNYPSYATNPVHMSQHLPVTFYAQCCMTNGWQLVLWLLLMPNCTHVRILGWMQGVLELEQCTGAAVDVISARWLPVCSSSSQFANQPRRQQCSCISSPPSRSPAVQLLMTLVLNFPRAVLLVPVAKFLLNPEAHMLLHSLSLSLSQAQECHPDWTGIFECFCMMAIFESTTNKSLILRMEP